MLLRHTAVKNFLHFYKKGLKYGNDCVEMKKDLIAPKPMHRGGSVVNRKKTRLHIVIEIII